MRINLNGKKGVVGLIMTVLLLAPGLVQAKDWGKYKEHRAKIMKELNLSQDESKKMQAVDEKYVKEHKDILEDLKKNRKALKEALAQKKPDEAKIKDLVSSITGDQDKLMETLKSQRDDELAILSPVQQGKYLMAMGQWRHKMMEKQMKK